MMNPLPFDTEAETSGAAPAPVVKLEARRSRKKSQIVPSPPEENPHQTDSAGSLTSAKPYDLRVPYRQLFASTLNYRQVRDPEFVEELAEDILVNGLVQNLIGRPAPGNLYEVFAGGTRYQSLALLVEQGRWDPDEINIPIQVREGLSDADLLLLSLSENKRRRDTHWLEDAKAIGLAIEALAGPDGPQRGDGLTAALAERLRMTRRWIQILYQLDRDLHPDLKAFFLEHREISIEVAKAVRVVPAECQLPALAQLRASVANGWRIIPEALQNLLTSSLPRAEHALFDRSLYDGPSTTVEVEAEPNVEEYFEVPASDEIDETRSEPGDANPSLRTAELFLDTETFTRLQEQAIAARRDELALQYPFVHILRTDKPWQVYDEYRRMPGHAEAGAVLVVTPELRVTVETDMVPVELLATTSPDSSKPAQPAEPLTKAHLSTAHRLKTAAIQRCLAASPANAARAAILAFLAYSSICRMDTAPLTNDDRCLDPTLFPTLRLLAHHFGDLISLPQIPDDDASTAAAPIFPDCLPHFGFRSHDRGDAAERAISILANLPDEEVLQIFCATVAIRTGTFCDYAPSLGDRPAATTFALAVGADAEKAFLDSGGLTETYLKGYRKPHLIRVARACGVEADSLEKLTQAELRNLILRSPGRKDFFPPELRFGSDKTLGAAIAAVGEEPRKKKPAKKASSKK